MASEPKINMLEEVLHGLGRMAWAPFRAFLSVVHCCTDNYRALAPRAKNDTWIVVGVLIVAAAVGAVFTFDIFTYSYWKARGSDNAGEIVRNLGLLAAAIVGLGFGIWRARTAHVQSQASHTQAETGIELARIAAQGQVTDRYAKAVELLGAQAAGTRIGGLYALSRIAQDSPEHDFRPVMDTLTEFVRNPPYKEEQRERSAAQIASWYEVGTGEQAIICPDVQVAIKVISGHPADENALGNTTEVDGAQLRLLELDGANFSHWSLVVADFRQAVVSLANFSGANLHGAYFSGALLIGAEFNGAYLDKANFHDAYLAGTALAGAEGLTQSQINVAHASKPPESLPPHIVWPFEEIGGEWVKKT